MIRLIARVSLALVAAVCLGAAGAMLRSLEVAPLVGGRVLVGLVGSWLLTAVACSLAGDRPFRTALRPTRPAPQPTDRYLVDALLLTLSAGVLLLVLPPDTFCRLLLRWLPESFPGGLDDVPRSAGRYLAATAAFGVGWLATLAALIAEAVAAHRRRGLTPREGLAVIAAVYAGLAIWTVPVQSLTGDEPHYLLATRSLLRDGDLDLTEDYARHRYREFWPSDTTRRALAEQTWRKLDPHEVRDAAGRGRPIHQVGLSLLLLPGYAVVGRAGAQLIALLLGIVAAAGAGRLTLALRDDGAGWAAAAALAFGSPLLAYSCSLHSEPAAAAGLAYLAWLTVGGRSRTRWPAAMVLLVVPWLHWKFLPAAFLLTVFLLLDDRRARRSDALLPPAGLLIGVLSQLLLFVALYGSPWPDAPQRLAGGRFPGLFGGNPLVGLPGLLVDQQDGLLWAWPLALTAVPALALGLRRGLHARLLAVIAVHAVIIAWYALWGSGHAPAGRQLLPIVPLLGPFIAAGIGWLAARRPRVVLLLATANALLVGLLALVPRLRYPVLVEDRPYQPLLRLFGEPWLDVLVPAVRDGSAALATAWVYLALLAAWAVLAARGADGILSGRIGAEGEAA